MVREMPQVREVNMKPSQLSVCVSHSSNEEYHLTCQGVHEVVVNTWRPSGFRVLDKLKRFFVGGAPQIDDISYVTQPTDFQVGMKQEDNIVKLSLSCFAFSGNTLEQIWI